MAIKMKSVEQYFRRRTLTAINLPLKYGLQNMQFYFLLWQKPLHCGKTAQYSHLQTRRHL